MPTQPGISSLAINQFAVASNSVNLLVPFVYNRPIPEDFNVKTGASLRGALLSVVSKADG